MSNFHSLTVVVGRDSETQFQGGSNKLFKLDNLIRVQLSHGCCFLLT